MDIVRELTGLLGPDAVAPPDRLALQDPGVDPANATAACEVAPADAAGMRALFEWASALGVPVVPQGGRTGLAGGATGAKGAVLLSPRRLERICDIDPVSRVARLSSGMTLAAAEAAARQHGLSLGIDLAARDTATIGGMISTNAGGMEAFRNGVMRDRVLGLEAVLPDGTHLQDLARVRKCNEGYDIKQLLIGAEGTLGFILGATLQLVPAPPPARTALVAARDGAAALALFHALERAPDLTLLRAEAMWPAYARLTAELHGQEAVLAEGAGLYLVLDLAGADVESALFGIVEPALDGGTLIDVLVAASAAQAAAFWALREDSFAVSRRHPHALWFDVSAPLAELDAYVARTEARIAEIDGDLTLLAIAHLGDGNLHYTVGWTKPLPDTLAGAVRDAVYGGLKAIGGSFSAEHGIGTEKAAALARLGDPGKRVMLERVKAVFDPAGICNPGKVLR